MFFKKITTFFVVVALALCAVLMSAQTLFAKANTDDRQDSVFLEFVREDTGIEQIDYTSIELYDQDLNATGRQYVFTVGGVSGYALTSSVWMGNSKFYEVEELFYNVSAPFTGYQGYPVYITFKTYLDCVDGVFYDLSSNRTVVDEQTIAELSQNGFGYRGNSSGDYIHHEETINYSTRTVDAYSFPYRVPNIDGGGAGTCCANIAGAVVISYYDRFFENLMPNYQSYSYFLGALVYDGTSSENLALVDTMRDYMAVEGITQGTTFTGFQNGMERYVEEQGYTYSTSSVMSWGQLDLQTYKSVVQTETPVALFLNGFTMGEVNEGEDHDFISSSIYQATHVEVGFGYKCYTYYDASGNVIATRNFLHVASGLLSYGLGYLNINSTVGGQIVNAIAIDIY